jgi:hypothetical protein
MSDKTKINEVIAELGLTMTTEFVPWSKSRNADQKDPSLNWKVTILRNDRSFLTTDYSAGMGHCPSYGIKNKPGTLPYNLTVHGDAAIKNECETGYSRVTANKPIVPDFADVLHSLVMDSDVIDYPTYEDWAGNFGYDPDSRKGEAIYRACLEIALKMRNAIGEDGLAKLRDAFQDY